MTVSAGSRRLKVLFFAQRFPYPMDTGGKIRTGKLLEYLRQVFDVTLISNVESPKDDPYIRQAIRLCGEFLPVQWKEMKKYSLRFYLKIFFNSFSKYPVTVINDYSEELEKMLHEALTKKKYDLVICDFLQPSINCLSIASQRTLLFQHNVEAVIPRRHFQMSKDPLSRLFWWGQWKKMERYEKTMCQWFDAVVTVSEADKRLIEKEYGAKAVFAIPTGIDTGYFTPQEASIEDGTLIFTGSMDWLPNEDAILYFAREILWRIKREIPGVKLTVVGRNPSRRLLLELAQYQEIEVVGWVQDVRPYINRKAVYVIPLRIGGGTRIKAYEALAMAKAMVSTSVGIEGLPICHDEHALLADTPQEFADAVVRLLKHGSERVRLGHAAMKYVRDNFSWENAGRSFAESCIRTVQN